MSKIHRVCLRAALHSELRNIDQPSRASTIAHFRCPWLLALATSPKAHLNGICNVIQAHDLVSPMEYAYISHCSSNIIEHVHDALQPADALLDDPSRLLQTIVWMGFLRLCQIPSSVVDQPTALQQR